MFPGLKFIPPVVEPPKVRLAFNKLWMVPSPPSTNPVPIAVAETEAVGVPPTRFKTANFDEVVAVPPKRRSIVEFIGVNAFPSKDVVHQFVPSPYPQLFEFTHTVPVVWSVRVVSPEVEKVK